MSHPAPSNAKPIRLTATRSHRKARNSLIRGVLEPNFMPFGQEPTSLKPVRTEDDLRRLGLLL
jgi:hypothetical protein